MELGLALGVSGGAPSTGGAVTPTLIIDSVSQSYGKAAGGSTLYVLGSNFVVGMTALLSGGGAFGIVSGVTENACVITTNAGSAGTSDTWHLHAAGRNDSSAQSWGWVAAPVQSAISPTSGPGTLTNTGVVFTVSGLGAAGSNIPIGGTVGSGAIHGDNVSITAANSFTADFDAPGIGADAVAVTVDGVAATGSVTFTGNTAPIFSSSTEVSTAGGVSRIRGGNFDNSGTGIVVKIGGATATVASFIDSTNMLVNAPAHAAGTTSIQITNPDGQSVTNSSGFTYAATSDPATIFGANLIAWYAPDSMSASGGVLNTWADKSGNNYTLSPVGTKATYNAADANFNGLATADGAGVAAYTAASMSLGSTGQGFFIAIVGRVNSAPGSTSVIATYDGTSCEQQLQTTGIVRLSCHGLNVNASATSIVGSTVQYYTHFPAGTNGTSVTSSAATSNATPTTTTATESGTMGASSTFGLFGRTGGTLPTDITIAEVVVVRMNTFDQTAINNLSAYFFFKYGFTSPALSTSQLPTEVSTSGGGSRFLGSSFVNGMTIALQSGGSAVYGPTAANVKSSTVAELPSVSALTAGSYDVVLTNPDGGTQFSAGAFTVTATKTPMTIFGLSCVALWKGSHLTQASGNVTAITDMSNSGQDMTTTSTTKPTYTATDSTFNNQPTWSTNGTSSWIQCAGFVLSSSIGQSLYYGAAVRFPVLPAGNQVPLSYNVTGLAEVQLLTTGHVEEFALGTAALWGADIHSATTPHYVRIHVPAGTSGTSHTTAINVDNGTEVTATANYSATLAASGAFTTGARGNNTVFAQASYAEVIVVQGDPTLTQESDYHAYLQTTYGVP